MPPLSVVEHFCDQSPLAELAYWVRLEKHVKCTAFVVAVESLPFRSAAAALRKTFLKQF